MTVLFYWDCVCFPESSKWVRCFMRTLYLGVLGNSQNRIHAVWKIAAEPLMHSTGGWA
jgi:hypothetical protein